MTRSPIPCDTAGSRLLGGSRARGEHTPESDFDLGLYYRPPLDIDALQDLARILDGRRRPTVPTLPVGSRWPRGGGWLHIDGAAVDWLYRDLDRVHKSWEDAQAGRYDLPFQIGHPFGVPDFMYAGEVALGVVLADPSGEITALQQKTRRYPPPLRDALVAGLWEASFDIDIARKAVTRRDTAYVAGACSASLRCAPRRCTGTPNTRSSTRGTQLRPRVGCRGGPQAARVVAQ